MMTSTSTSNVEAGGVTVTSSTSVKGTSTSAMAATETTKLPGMESTTSQTIKVVQESSFIPAKITVSGCLGITASHPTVLMNDPVTRQSAAKALAVIVEVPEEQVDVEIQQSSDEVVCSSPRRLAAWPRLLQAGSLIISYVISFETSVNTGSDLEAHAESVKKVLETVSETEITSRIMESLNEAEPLSSVELTVDSIGEPVLVVVQEASGTQNQTSEEEDDSDVFELDARLFILFGVALLFPTGGLWIFCRRRCCKRVAHKAKEVEARPQRQEPNTPVHDLPELQGVSEIEAKPEKMELAEEDRRRPAKPTSSVMQAQPTELHPRHSSALEERNSVPSPFTAEGVAEATPSDGSESSDLDIFHPYPVDILPCLDQEKGPRRQSNMLARKLHKIRPQKVIATSLARGDVQLEVSAWKEKLDEFGASNDPACSSNGFYISERTDDADRSVPSLPTPKAKRSKNMRKKSRLKTPESSAPLE